MTAAQLYGGDVVLGDEHRRHRHIGLRCAGVRLADRSTELGRPNLYPGAWLEAAYPYHCAALDERPGHGGHADPRGRWVDSDFAPGLGEQLAGVVGQAHALSRGEAGGRDVEGGGRGLGEADGPAVLAQFYPGPWCQAADV